MDVSKIYFDMDGVLADFDRGVKELCGMEPLDQLTATEEETDRLWFAISQVDHYYDRLELIPGADTMLLAFMEKYGDRCEILTGIPKPKRHVENAGEDKEIWEAVEVEDGDCGRMDEALDALDDAIDILGDIVEG